MFIQLKFFTLTLTSLKQNLRPFKSFSSSEKLIAGGAILTILGLFFPWFSINNVDLFQDQKYYLGFTGLTYIIGYLCYFFALLALNQIDKKLALMTGAGGFMLLFLVKTFGNQDAAELSWLTLLLFLIAHLVFFPLVNYLKILRQIKNHTLNIFIGVESLILIFVAFMISQKMAFNYTNAPVSFGLYFSFFSAAILLYGGYMQLVENRKKAIREIFTPAESNLHSGIRLEPDFNIDKTASPPNKPKENVEAEKQTSQLSLGDYE